MKTTIINVCNGDNQVKQRFIKFLIEQEASGEGYVEAPQSGPATTTNNVVKFYDKIGSKPARRLRKKKKKTEDNIYEDFYTVIWYNTLNEASILPDFVFNTIKSVGEYIGLKVKKSDSLIDYLSSAEEEFVRLYNLLCLYIIATGNEKAKLKADIKKELKKVNIKRFTAFLLQTEKLAFGLTSIVRHLLMTIFGVEITSYNKWVTDIEYILTHLKKIKDVLSTMNPTKEELDAFDRLYDVIVKTKSEIELSKGV